MLSFAQAKQKLQVIAPPSMANIPPAIKAASTVNIKGELVDFDDEVEHLGVIRSSHGNGVNLLNRYSSTPVTRRH